MSFCFGIKPPATEDIFTIPNFFFNYVLEGEEDLLFCGQLELSQFGQADLRTINEINLGSIPELTISQFFSPTGPWGPVAATSAAMALCMLLDNTRIYFFPCSLF